MGGGASELSVFTVPSRPTTGQRVAFVARYTGTTKIARIDIIVNGRIVKSCEDSACQYHGGPFQAGTLKYTARAFDTAGKRFNTAYRDLAIRAVDTKPPILKISHRPARPTSKQRLTFTATATDPSGVAKIEILVNKRVKKSSAGERCTFSAGPFAAGTVTYGANAYARAGNQAWSGTRRVVVAKPEPVGDSTISGRVTGKRNLISQVCAYNMEQPNLQFTAKPDSSGSYRIRNLPDGRYRVYSLSRGKFELIAQPNSRDIRCRGNKTYTANFDIKGAMEG